MPALESKFRKETLSAQRTRVARKKGAGKLSKVKDVEENNGERLGR